MGMKWKSKKYKYNMSCFIVPLVQAAATSIYRKAHPGATQLQDLEKMLWGGSVMLVVDHVINGELTWRFPFLTALGETGGWSVVLREMLTVGVPMSLALTLVWVVWTALKSRRVTG